MTHTPTPETHSEPFAYAHPNGTIWRLDNYPAGMDFTKDGWFPLFRSPTAKDALQAIANLPTAETLDRMNGQEDACRAVEALFSSPPHITVATPSPETRAAPSTYDALYECLKSLGYVGSLELTENNTLTSSWIGKPGEGSDVEIKVSITSSQEQKFIINENGKRIMTASDLTDTELLDELRKRRHRFSPDEYMSQDQCDDRAKLGVLRGLIVTMWKMNPFDSAISILHSKCDELDSIYGNPLPARAFAVNTTLPGREDSYDK